MFNKPLIFDEKVLIDVKEINFIPSNILSENFTIKSNNYTIQNKINQYKNEINKKELDNVFSKNKNLFLLELVFDVTQTKEKTIYIQDYFDFETIADIKFEGAIYEEKWQDGILWLDDTYKTFLDSGQTKRMRMYFCIPEEMILEKEILIKENNSNQLFCINVENVNNNGWIELKIGDVIESEEYSITINHPIEFDSEINPEVELYVDTKFYGLNVTIENKTSKSFNVRDCVQHTYMYAELYYARSADQYMVINKNNFLAEGDVTRDFIRIGPYEKVTLDFGFTWNKAPKKFLLFQNQKFYYLKIN